MGFDLQVSDRSILGSLPNGGRAVRRAVSASMVGAGFESLGDWHVDETVAVARFRVPGNQPGRASGRMLATLATTGELRIAAEVPAARRRPVRVLGVPVARSSSIVPRRLEKAAGLLRRALRDLDASGLSRV